MTTETEVVREVLLSVEVEPRSVVGVVLRETFLVVSTTGVTAFCNVREVAQLNDHYYESAPPLLHETALLRDAVTLVVHPVVVVREVTKSLSRALETLRIPHTEREVALLRSRDSTRVGQTVREVAVLSGGAHPTIQQVVVVRETAALLSAGLPPTGITVREVAQLGERETHRVLIDSVLREVAQLGDRTSYPVAHDYLVRDVFRGLSRATGQNTYRSILRDVFYVDDTPVMPNSGLAYTCSVITWGMSQLKNFPFRTMAGNVAAGDNLWRLDHDDDYGTPINSYIKTGILDTGAGQKKRVTAVYAAGSADEPLDVSVTGDVGGVQQTHNYTMELRDQANYRNNRTLVGKGFHSRFVQFKIGATGTNQYRLLTADADLAVSPRRV